MTITVFLTGSTGFLGAQIAFQLLRSTDAAIIALVRAADSAAARERLRREWWDWPELISALDERVEALPGDISQPRLALTADAYTRLVQQVTHIIHAAADVRLFAPIGALRRVNVTGTRHIIELARAVQQHHPLQRLAYVSTAYVAGERSGPVPEDELTDSFGFSSPYERSKYEAELLVREAGADLPVSIFRPGMIVGDSRSGAVKSFNTLYYPLRLYMTGRLRSAPARPDLRIDLAPVDYIAGAVTHLTFHPSAAGLTFHLTPPLEDTPTLEDFTQAVRAWARSELDLRLPRPLFLPMPWLARLTARPALRALIQKLAGRDLAHLTALLPYFRKQPCFLRENTDRLLGPYPHRWQALLPPLLAYAVQHSFWQRSHRTVYEQILFRLQSRSRPVTFHDLSPRADTQQVLHETIRPPAEIRAEIIAAASALRALGIQPGQRVALLGPNSTRYFSSIVACGLAGAISVPIYPTTPIKEIELLLRDCQARLFLVGAPEVLAQLAEIHLEVPVISLCQPGAIRQSPPASGRPLNVYSWPEFLSLAAPTGALPPVALDAPAVLFYTSGTTGRPKGVIFRHEQLRWLAETLASMYPWRERNRWGSYLSYLPMSHVVEGILATYSPYYVPAALDIYFLDDFQALPQALKIARPTIFFSVPRFFEKVRAAFLQNRLARAYLRMPEGYLRDLLRALLRRGLLRKAGLNGARQMLVGSAPTPPELLAFFQDLGIQVHDAYGLTEAPLVALNRLGRNRVDTVGQPLPETELRFEADGELLVRGPQVACGYLEDGRLQGFPGGWFPTGDLGSLTPGDYLTLHGRKKDILITAYGENIFPLPVESRLRAIPGVAEALLVGDGRPYCAALFWLEEDTWSEAAARVIEAGVQAVNEALPRPARVRRWAVMRGSLTVANGSLTGSMKVKRALVAERLAAAIEAMYRNEVVPEMHHCHG